MTANRHRTTPAVLAALIALNVTALAQRRGAGKTAGEPAKVLYQQDFEKRDQIDFEATGYCSARFLKATMPKVLALVTPKDFETRWRESGVGGSAGALEIVRTGENSLAAAEMFMDFPGDDTTIAFAYRAHGLDGGEGLYIQGWGNKIGKNLHAYVNIAEEDVWQIAKIKVPSLVGFGGGACAPGETFGNLAFVVSWDGGADEAHLLVDNVVVFQGADGRPPSRPPSSLTVTRDGGNVVLTWSPAEDDLGLLSYDIHRSQTMGFAPRRSNRIGSVRDTRYRDRDAPATKAYYVVVGRDMGGFKVNSAPFEYTPKAAAEGPAPDELEF